MCYIARPVRRPETPSLKNCKPIFSRLYLGGCDKNTCRAPSWPRAHAGQCGELKWGSPSQLKTCRKEIHHDLTWAPSVTTTRDEGISRASRRGRRRKFRGCPRNCAGGGHGCSSRQTSRRTGDGSGKFSFQSRDMDRGCSQLERKTARNTHQIDRAN